jgi:phosphate uptake regulator
VLKHLAVTGGMNIIPGLILTSVVIDLERIGDYTKNITDLAVAHPRRLSAGILKKIFKKFSKLLLIFFISLSQY